MVWVEFLVKFWVFYHGLARKANILFWIQLLQPMFQFIDCIKYKVHELICQEQEDSKLNVVKAVGKE